MQNKGLTSRIQTVTTCYFTDAEIKVAVIRLTKLGRIKGARSRYFGYFCLILLIMSSKRQSGRPRVIHLQNHGHITTENDFPAV